MDTRETVVELHRAYRAGDVAAVAALIHDDIDWVIHGPPKVFPFGGRRKGKAQVLDTLAQIGALYELKRYDHEILIVEGERAAVLSQTEFVQRADSRTLQMELVNLFRIRNGQIVEFREYSNTFDAVEQALGAALHVLALPAAAPR